MTNTYIHLAIFTAESLLILWIAKWVFDFITPGFNEDHAIVEDSHLSAGIRRSGLLLGVGLAISAALTGGYHTLWVDVQEIAIYGIASIVMMLGTLKINDWILFSGRNNDAAIESDNQAVAWAEFGSAVSTGIIAFASFAGEGTLLSAITFFLAGQFALILFVALYEAFNRKFSFTQEISDNRNISAGVLLGLTMIAFSIILFSSIYGPFKGDWTTAFYSFGISAIVGIIVMVIANVIADVIMLPKSTIFLEIARDKNVSAAVVVGVTKIAIALFVCIALLGF